MPCVVVVFRPFLPTEPEGLNLTSEMLVLEEARTITAKSRADNPKPA